MSRARPLHDAHVRSWLAMLVSRIRSRSLIDGECWIWTGAFSNRGRKSRGKPVPVFALPNRGGLVGARRIAAQSLGRDLPPGKVVSTRCGNWQCVNPEHTIVWTREKAAEAAKKRGAYPTLATAIRLRAARSNLNVLIDMETARMIRQRYAETGNAAQVAREFGIKHDHAHKIARGKLWAEPNPFSGLARL